MAWCMYGSKAGKYHDHTATHTQYQATYRTFLRAPHTLALSFNPPDSLLTVSAVQKIFGITPFTAYQVLGDFAHLTSFSLVSVSPRDLGTGAHLGAVPIDWYNLQNTLYHSATFREWYGGRIRILDLGHLVCEIRQNLHKQSLADLAGFVRGVKRKGAPVGDHELKRDAAKRVARYALAC